MAHSMTSFLFFSASLVLLDAKISTDFSPTHAVEASLSKPMEGDTNSMQAKLPEAESRRLRGTTSKNNPFMNMIIGIAMWCCCIPCMMYNNERIAVKQAKLQGKALSDSIEIEDVDRKPLEEMNGHIVFMSGDSECKEVLCDKYFPGARSTNCLKLRRIVEMKQHVEKEHDNDGRKTYSHSIEWKDSPQSCPKGGVSYQNPPMPFPSSQRSLVDYRAHVSAGDGSGEECAEARRGSVRVGAYYLGEFVIRELVNWQKKEVDSNTVATNNPDLNKLGKPTLSDGWWQWGTGANVGDVRVRFEELQCGPISLCGVLTRVGNGWTLVPIMRVDGNSKENCAQEFGFTCSACPCAPERLVFPADPSEDEEFLGELEDYGVELTQGEQDKFLKHSSAHMQNFYQVEEGSSWMNPLMHWVGLEEEFLGVAEEYMSFDEMLSAESAHSGRKHCACRIASILLGAFASSMIISPFTHILTYNWFITAMGGGAIACLLSCVSCFISVTVALCIIGSSWFVARPRLGATLLCSAALVGISVAVFMTSHSHDANPTNSTAIGNVTITSPIAA